MIRSNPDNLESPASKISEDHRLRILLLCDYDPTNAGTVVDNIDAFRNLSRHEYVVRSGRGDFLSGVDLKNFDGIFIHYSLVACYDSYLAPETRRKIRTFQGYKALYIQDEYRFIDQTIAALNYMQIHALFSVVPPEARDQIYTAENLPGVDKTTLLTGYVPDTLIDIATPPYAERPIDISYRARKLPAYLGSHTLQKWQIADRFNEDAPRYGLKTDISWREEDRIYGADWVKFVANSKATLGTESGASVCDFTGEIQRNVEHHVHTHPEATFAELRTLYFDKEDGAIVINCISPRCFEAAALKALMIMYEGEYSGVLTPWRHYVPLKRDHSNMEEVVAILRNPERAQIIIDTAYQEIILSGRYSYRSMISQIDQVMEELIGKGLKPSPLPRAKFRKDLLINQVARALHLQNRVCYLKRALKYRAFDWISRNPRRKAIIKKIFFTIRPSAKSILEQPKKRVAAQAQSNIASATSLLPTHVDGRLHYWDLIALTSTFANDPSTMAELYFLPEQHLLQIVASPVGSSGSTETVEILEKKELHALICSGSVMYIQWINRDPYGLGTNLPSLPFQKIPVKNSLFLRYLFSETMPWVSACYQIRKPMKAAA